MSKRTMREKNEARITQLEKQVDCERSMILAMDQDSAQAILKRLNEQIRGKHEHLHQLEVTMSLKHDLEKARKQISLLANDKTQAIETTVQMWKRIHSAEAALAEASSEETNSLVCQEQIRNLAESLRNARNRLDLLEGKLISVTEERDTAQDSLATLSEKLDTKCVGCPHFNAETKLQDLKRALGIVLA